MSVILLICILFICFYMVKIVKKLRIHQFYSLNPHFYIRSIHSPIKNTPKHQVYTLAKRLKTFFYAILLFKRLFSPLWLEVPNPRKHRNYRLFQPLSFVIRAIHSTWHVPRNKSFIHRSTPSRDCMAASPGLSSLHRPAQLRYDYRERR